MYEVTERPALHLQPLFVLALKVDSLVDAGGPPGALRRVGPIDGGSFTGDRLSGLVLTGGADWQTLRSDGTVLLDARILLRTADGETIGMSYTGIRHGPTEVMARLGRGEPVDPSEYYFRIVGRFDTSARRYEWLNRIAAVGTGARLPEGPVYQVFELR